MPREGRKTRKAGHSPLAAKRTRMQAPPGEPPRPSPLAMTRTTMAAKQPRQRAAFRATVCVCVSMCVNVCECVHVRGCMRVCVRARLYACVSGRRRTRARVCARACARLVHVCVCVCVRARTRGSNLPTPKCGSSVFTRREAPKRLDDKAARHPFQGGGDDGCETHHHTHHPILHYWQ